MRKVDPHTCLGCGRYFHLALGIHYKWGFMCAKCHREGPPEAVDRGIRVDSSSQLDLYQNATKRVRD